MGVGLGDGEKRKNYVYMNPDILTQRIKKEENAAGEKQVWQKVPEVLREPTQLAMLHVLQIKEHRPKATVL